MLRLSPLFAHFRPHNTHTHRIPLQLQHFCPLPPQPKLLSQCCPTPGPAPFASSRTSPRPAATAARTSYTSSTQIPNGSCSSLSSDTPSRHNCSAFLASPTLFGPPQRPPFAAVRTAAPTAALRRAPTNISQILPTSTKICNFDDRPSTTVHFAESPKSPPADIADIATNPKISPSQPLPAAQPSSHSSQFSRNLSHRRQTSSAFAAKHSAPHLCISHISSRPTRRTPRQLPAKHTMPRTSLPPSRGGHDLSPALSAASNRPPRHRKPSQFPQPVLFRFRSEEYHTLAPPICRAAPLTAFRSTPQQTKLHNSTFPPHHTTPILHNLPHPTPQPQWLFAKHHQSLRLLPRQPHLLRRFRCHIPHLTHFGSPTSPHFAAHRTIEPFEPRNPPQFAAHRHQSSRSPAHLGPPNILLPIRKDPTAPTTLRHLT